MPHANVWIRSSNWEKWDKLSNKSEWLNAVLKNADDTSEWGKTHDTPVGPAITILTETVPTPGGITTADNLPKNLCEHGQVKGQCFTKGCKFSRFKR